MHRRVAELKAINADEGKLHCYELLISVALMCPETLKRYERYCGAAEREPLRKFRIHRLLSVPRRVLHESAKPLENDAAAVKCELALILLSRSQRRLRGKWMSALHIKTVSQLRSVSGFRYKCR